jgi:hypothetical protein
MVYQHGLGAADYRNIAASLGPAPLQPARAGWQKAALGLALAAVPVMIVFRLEADLKPFSLLLAATALLWSLALLRNKAS